MWDWISKVDPNVVVGLLVAVGGFVYHQFSPSTQKRIAESVSQVQKNALAVADQVMAGLAITAAFEGKSAADLRAQLWAAAKIQLGHVGMNPDNLPPAVVDAIDALVGKYITGYAPGK